MKATNSHQDQNVLKNRFETVTSSDMALSSCYRPEIWQKYGSVKGCGQYRPDHLWALAAWTMSQFRTFFVQTAKLNWS